MRELSNNELSTVSGGFIVGAVKAAWKWFKGSKKAQAAVAGEAGWVAGEQGVKAVQSATDGGG